VCFILIRTADQAGGKVGGVASQERTREMISFRFNALILTVSALTERIVENIVLPESFCLLSTFLARFRLYPPKANHRSDHRAG
jgi:hypothetical protein